MCLLGNYFEKLVLSTHEFYRKPYMVGLWRSICRDRLYFRWFCVVSDDCRDPVRLAMFQAGRVDALAFWQADRPYAQQHGLYRTFL